MVVLFDFDLPIGLINLVFLVFSGFGSLVFCYWLMVVALRSLDF